jgi:hypothetical protein
MYRDVYFIYCIDFFGKTFVLKMENFDLSFIMKYELGLHRTDKNQN